MQKLTITLFAALAVTPAVWAAGPIENTMSRTAAAPAAPRVAPLEMRVDDRSDAPLPAAIRAEVDDCIRTFRGLDEEAKGDALRRVVGLGVKSVPYLLDVLRHVPEDAGLWIVRTLRQLRDPAASYPLMNRYSQASVEMKGELLAAVGASGDPRSISFLVVALDESEVALRRQAAMALAAFQDPTALRGLLRALEDDDWCVRREAVRGLRGIADRLVVVDLVDRLLTRLPRFTPESRSDAVRVLASLRDPRVVEPVADYLRLGSPEMRVLCARALGLLGDERGVRALERAVSDEDAAVRAEAVRSLATLSGYEAFRPLVECLEREESRRVQRVIRLALRDLVGRDLGPDPASWYDWRDHGGAGG